MRTEKPSAGRVSLRAGLLAAILVMFAADHGSGQTRTTGAVSGHVIDMSGAPLSNVLVTLRDTASGTTLTAGAARAGTFRLDGLPPGLYTLTAERIGFAPLRIIRLDVRPGHELSLRLELTSADATDVATDERVGPAAVNPAGATEWVPRFALRHLSGRTHTLRESGRFSSRVDDHFATEGLPGWLSAVAVDGTPFRVASGILDRRGVTSTAFPAVAFDGAQFMANPLDVEWSGAAGSLLSVYTFRGADPGGGSIEGRWSGDVLSLSSLDAGSVTFADVRGGTTLHGPLSGAGGRFSIGMDARREQRPVSSAWQDSDAAQRLAETGTGLESYRQAALTGTTALAGFARVDWPLTERHQAGFAFHAAALPAIEMVVPGGAIAEQDGLDIVVNAGVLSEFGAAFRNELRATISSSERATADESTELPFTMIAHEALAFGNSPEWMLARDAHVGLSDAIHYRAGGHVVKLGGGVTLSGYRYEAAERQLGEYSFGSVDEFLAGRGVLTRTEAAGSTTDWSDRTLAVFAQDRFTIADVEIMAGLRAERQTLTATVQRDSQWTLFTGVANDEVEPPGVRLSPRASAIWNVGGSGQWVVGVAGGIYYDRLDPLVLASWQHDDGSREVRRVVGAVTWPPADNGGGRVSPRLTVLGSGFEAARTLRVTGGFSVPPFAGTTLSVSGVVRRTENLPRRTDLNLVALPTARDQHDRAVYGTLVKQGGLVAAVPGSNRRFGTYDEVAGIITDRTSEHWGVSVSLDRALDSALGFVARYTFGHTTDDWFGAQDGGWSRSAPQGLGQDSTWVEAKSDLDVPHRLVAGLLWTGPGSVQIGAAYRVQSGRPFTPGFRAGVDTNGDGVAGNDPAFVDESVEGMDALISSWACLRESRGAFAQRNGCRTAAAHGLDINLAVPLLRVGAGVASARLDLFDVLESVQDAPDAALYLIDPAADLVTDPVARTVTLPLVANERFGEAQAARRSGRIIRLGFSINW